MDVEALERLKDDLLHGRIFEHRRLLVGMAVFMLAFFAVTLVGGYLLVTHAMDDNHATATRGINTPSQVGLLFTGHRPAELVNSLVFLNRVKLEPASKTGQIYYAGDDSGTRMIVVSHQPGAPNDDATANVMGTIRPVTSDLMKKWKLSKEEQKAVKAQGVYLEAESLKVKKDAATVASK